MESAINDIFYYILLTGFWVLVFSIVLIVLAPVLETLGKILVVPFAIFYHLCRKS